MADNFYVRLAKYFEKVAEVMRGEADAASVFANASDIGGGRERVYAAFLKQHAPSKCNVFLGRFLFHEDGSESDQIDIIVTTDTAPRFDFHNQDGGGKSFSPVEGTLAVVSVKSKLDKKELFNSLMGSVRFHRQPPLIIVSPLRLKFLIMKIGHTRFSTQATVSRVVQYWIT